MSDGVSIGEDTIEASKGLTPGADAADTSVQKVSAIYYNQTDGRWGYEDGPAAFRVRYRSELFNLEQDLKLLADRLDAYVAAVQKAAKNFRDKDDEAAESFRDSMEQQANKEAAAARALARDKKRMA